MMIEKVWYGEKRDGGKFIYLQKVPFFFLKRVEQEKAWSPESMIFGGFVSTGQLRRWARAWLRIKKVSEIKVW